MKTQNILSSILYPSWFYPLLLIIIGLFSYVISSPALGFYWDDWQAIFLYQNYSPEIVRNFFIFDRPFSAWTYEATFPFIPLTPITWHLFTMLTRVIAIWVLISALELLWSDRRNLLRWTGALLVVFPSFTMQSISIAFNQHFITFLLFSFSIYSMLLGLAINSRWRWFLLLFSLITTVVHILTMEYYIGLEAIRPFILYFAINKGKDISSIRKKFLHTLKFYVPYLIIIIGFLFWRIQIYPQQLNANPALEDPNTPTLLKALFTSPIQTSVKLGNLILQDSVFLLTQSWLRSLEPASIRLDAAFNLLSWIVGLLLSGLFLFWSHFTTQTTPATKSITPYKHIVIIGILALLFGGLPVWITDRQILVGKWSDRFSLAPTIGVVLLITLCIHWLIQSTKKKNLIFLLILGLSIAFQIRVTHEYALDWQNQRNFYWQLYWRVPVVKPGTAFFSAKLPSNYSSDYSIGFSLNTLYAQNYDQTNLAHWYFDPGSEGLYFYKLAPDQDITYIFRNLEYKGSTSNALAYLFQPASGCFILLDEAYAANPNMDSNHAPLIPLTNTNQIDLDSEAISPDRRVFGNEPPHDWCYYFEKADLARQNKKWSEALTIMEEALQLGLSPKSGVERMPELEAHFYTGNWQPFVAISQSVLSENQYMDRFLCTQWDRLTTESGMPFPEDVQSQLTSIVDCSQPFNQ